MSNPKVDESITAARARLNWLAAQSKTPEQIAKDIDAVMHALAVAESCKLILAKDENDESLLERLLSYLESYKESSPPTGCVYCGFASRECQLDLDIKQLKDFICSTQPAGVPCESETVSANTSGP